MKGVKMEKEEAYIMSLFRNINNALFLQMNRLYEPYGLTAIQFSILMELKLEDNQTVSQLASKLQMSMSNISAIIQRMEKHGFVNRIRNDQDQRTVQVSVSKKTIAMLDDIELQLNNCGCVLSRLSSDEKQAIIQGLETLHKVIKECGCDE